MWMISSETWSKPWPRCKCYTGIQYRTDWNRLEETLSWQLTVVWKLRRLLTVNSIVTLIYVWFYMESILPFFVIMGWFNVIIINCLREMLTMCVLMQAKEQVSFSGMGSMSFVLVCFSDQNTHLCHICFKVCVTVYLIMLWYALHNVFAARNQE